jgi:error-prone DNA polymerase
MGSYVELHCHSNFSLLDGASHPEQMVVRAAELNIPALALTDHDAVYGAPRFFQAATEYGIKPILGAEITLSNKFHLTLLVENRSGWHNLCYLISRGRHGKPKGEAELELEELVGCTSGLIALSGCRHSEISAALLNNDREAALRAARRFSDLFGPENFWIELQRHHLPGEERVITKQEALASYLKLGCVVTNNVHYARQEGHRLQDVLVCIRHLMDLDELAQKGEVYGGGAGIVPQRRLNSEFYLKSAEEMAVLFPNHQEALENTLLLADRCSFDLQYGLQDLPQFQTPHGMSNSAYLRRLCEEGIQDRFGGDLMGTIASSGRERLDHELRIIERAGLANYFLIVWDIVRFARSQGIRCQGRGSAANSLVAYLLQISPIDPLSHDLVFERFLSEERQVVPDIDIDFDAQRREEVIQYIYNKYGPDHTAMACTFVTFQSRSALRDISKALNLPPETVAAATRILEGEPLPETEDHSGVIPVNLLLELCEQIDGFPRHLGIHSGGMIVTGMPLMGRVPTEPATMKDRVVVQWDKDGLEDTGLVKIDILGLRFLSAITETVASIEEISGAAPDLDSLSFDDPAVYDMLCQADTIGVFQVESRAQANTLPRFKPRNFDDLVISISLIRPGPIQGDMVHPFLRRRLGYTG